MDKVLVYYTGGTIGMIRNDQGQLVPDPNFPARMRRALETFPGIPEWEIVSRNPLLDSSNMTPVDWLEIARYIESRMNEFKSFVVLHGTDTMAYTTSALAFMISGLRKPIVFTGSQFPLSEPGNDATANLTGALQIAGDYRLPVPDVCLFFSSRLLRGCRATKVSSERLDAFDSPNADPLARAVKGGIRWNKRAPMRPEEGPGVALSVQELNRTQVGLLRLFPGISATITRNLLQPPLEGAVLLAYGSGNAPSGPDHVEFRRVLEAAARRGVLVACTQCLHGSVDLNRYATGLGALGVVSGYDMTPEAALTKLFWLLSRNLPLPKVREEMQVNLRGELTRPKAAADGAL